MNITLSNRPPIIDWDDLSSEHQERELTFSEDPLVLACAIKKTWDEHQQFRSLEDQLLGESIDDSVREKAESIRKYYSRKYFWSRLKNKNPLSPFRDRTLYLLESRTRTVKEKDKGIYFKLPWFYEEDMIYDEFKKNYETENVPPISYRGSKDSNKKILELSYLKSTIATQSKRKIERFWFTDGKYLYNIEIEQTNPLLDMFKGFIDSNPILKFNTLYQVSNIDRLHFYRLHNFNFVKDTNA